MAGSANPAMTQQPSAPSNNKFMSGGPNVTMINPAYQGQLQTADVPAAARPLAPQPAAPQPAAPNVFSQAASGINRAMSMAGGVPQAPTINAMNVSGGPGYSVSGIDVGTAVGGISDYMNPYTQQVVDTTMADLERQRQMALNTTGAQASAAGAFGGSRHGVAEALSNEAFARQGAQAAGQLRQQGFTTALGAAQQDIANRLMADMQTQQLGARASEFGADAALRAQLANQQAQLEAQRANQQAALTRGQLGIQGASTLGSLANTAFGMGQDVLGRQQAFGQQQRTINQALLDAARAQYGGFTGAPAASLSLPMQAVGAANMGQQTSRSGYQPGLFDYLSAGAQLFPF